MSGRKLADSFGWELDSEVGEPPKPNPPGSNDKYQQQPGNRVKYLTHRCNILEHEKQILMKQLFDREETIAQLQKQVQAQTNQYRSKHHSWEEANAGFKNELFGLNRQISELLDVIKTNKDEIAALSKRVNQTTDANQALKAKFDEINNELEYYKRYNAELAQYIKHLKFTKKESRDEYKKGYQTARNTRNSSVNRNKSPLQSNNQNVEPTGTSEHSRKLSYLERTSIIYRLKQYRKNLPKNLPKNQYFYLFLRTLRQFQ